MQFFCQAFDRNAGRSVFGHDGSECKKFVGKRRFFLHRRFKPRVELCEPLPFGNVFSDTVFDQPCDLIGKSGGVRKSRYIRIERVETEQRKNKNRRSDVDAGHIEVDIFNRAVACKKRIEHPYAALPQFPYEDAFVYDTLLRLKIHDVFAVIDEKINRLGHRFDALAVSIASEHPPHDFCDAVEHTFKQGLFERRFARKVFKNSRFADTDFLRDLRQ